MKSTFFSEYEGDLKKYKQQKNQKTKYFIRFSNKFVS
jgi:hypothetical protein